MGLKSATWFPAQEVTMLPPAQLLGQLCITSFQNSSFSPCSFTVLGQAVPAQVRLSPPTLAACVSTQISAALRSHLHKATSPILETFIPNLKKYSYSKINKSVNLLISLYCSQSDGEDTRWASPEQPPSLQLSPIIKNWTIHRRWFFFFPKPQF